jgi:hypothetical protein
MSGTGNHIFVRNDHQCLFAITDGEVYRGIKDPILRETYHAINLNDELVYYEDLLSGDIPVNDPVGMATVNSVIAMMEEMNQ